MKHCESNSLRWLVLNAACLGLACKFGINEGHAGGTEPPALRYTTTWLGNTFGGGDKWVQNFAEDLCVLGVHIDRRAVVAY